MRLLQPYNDVNEMVQPQVMKTENNKNYLFF